MINKEHLKRSILSLKNKVRGQNLVEVTLIMPIVVLLFAGMVEVGFAVQSYIVVSSAAREGARFGSRGIHVPFNDIADIIETSLGKSIAPKFSDPEADSKIIVTEVDLEEDGTYTIHLQQDKGVLPVSSSVCDSNLDACPSGSLDIQKIIEANKSFNINPDFCVGKFGCDGDFIVVEVVYFHKSVVLSGITHDLIPDPFPIKARVVMRVLSRRAPSSE
jgi:hypothetical protein